MGSRARSPRWALAYKYASEAAETTLLNIDIQVSE
jgi:NAD-dependent DNA ligase